MDPSTVSSQGSDSRVKSYEYDGESFTASGMDDVELICILEFLKAIEYPRSEELESQLRVTEEEVEALIEALDPLRQQRLECVCTSSRFSRFIECNSSRILVAHGNDIEQDAEQSLLSILSKRMCVAFQEIPRCMTISWTCGGEETHPERMVINLLGQLLSKSNMEMPVPEDDWQDLKFDDLVKILKDCLEVQLARTRVLCVIDSIQHYELGEAHDATKHVLDSISGLAEGFKDLNRVELKLFVTSLSACRYLTETESPGITRTFSMTEVPEQFGSWNVPEEDRGSREGPGHGEEEPHDSSHHGGSPRGRSRGRRNKE